MLARAGYAGPRLDPARLIARAESRTGVGDWGAPSFRAGLVRLCTALEREARLSPLGRVAAYLNLLDHLCVRLRLIDYRSRHPAVAAQRIRQPLFILGLPRTGTTILFELIAQDPSFRAPLSWEVTRPLPPPGLPGPRVDWRRQRVDLAFALLEQLAPGFRTIHAIGARLPQECVYMLAPAFASEQFCYMYDVPGYRDWLAGWDMVDAYRWHAQFLQHLQVGRVPGPWVLKTPAHLAGLPALLAQYPDARIVWTHRRPLQAVASFSSLTSTLRAGFCAPADPLATGGGELRHAARAVDAGLRARAQLGDGSRFVDVGFDAICADPLAVVERIYRHFNLPLTPQARGRMSAYLALRPRNLYGEHRYTPAAFGLRAADEEALFGPYLARFENFFSSPQC